MTKKYSLWHIVHESGDSVILEKHKDTNSTKEVEAWTRSGGLKAASFYREKDEYPAHYVQTFDE